MAESFSDHPISKSIRRLMGKEIDATRVGMSKKCRAAVAVDGRLFGPEMEADGFGRRQWREMSSARHGGP